jgi:hypothetical protein
MSARSQYCCWGHEQEWRLVAPLHCWLCATSCSTPEKPNLFHAWRALRPLSNPPLLVIGYVHLPSLPCAGGIIEGLP